VRMPSLGDFQVPPPPPPPPAPPPFHWLDKSSNWVAKHPWMTAGVAVSAVGTGLLVGYSTTHTRRRRGTLRLRTQQAKTADRRQVVGEPQLRYLFDISVDLFQLSSVRTHPLGSLWSWIWRRKGIL
jgi:hypothetical protein